MKYCELISKRKQYKYSANICFDLNDEERLADFIPNVTTTGIIREYLGGIIRGNVETHSRILYGSYGTGKSHLLIVLSAILEHINTESSGFNTFSKLIAKYDADLSEDIERYVKEEKPYLVVPVYADYDDFGKCITFSLKKELARHNVDVCFKGFYDEALELVNKWINGKDSSTRLIEESAKLDISISDLKKGLSEYDFKYEKIFEAIYSGMSYGAKFNSFTGNLFDNMDIANKAIAKKYRGIVIIFDEFGRYVEDFGEQIKVKSIQNLAEYCDHSGYDNHIILVSHKQLSMYTSNMKKNIAEEWKKVEGRFKPTSINIKYDQCLSLIGHIIPKTKNWDDFKVKYSNELTNLYNQGLDFKGFMLPPDAEGRSPFEDGFPLHPITLFALDRLSKKVAQNERTFFTYLAGDEENTLISQLEEYDTKEFHFIGLDAIYDYFELNIKTFKTDDSFVVYKKLQYALNKLGDNSNGYATKVLKAMAVINIIADMGVLVADKSTLGCVIDGDFQKVNNAIDFLEKKKIIRYMRQYGYYDFFDSSIFDLEEMIEEKFSGINDEMVVNILNEQFADFLLYPYGYNEKFHMNRVFIPVFAKKSNLTKRSICSFLPLYYDGAIVLVLDNLADEESYVGSLDLPSRTILLVNSKSKNLESEIKRYIAIQYFYTKKDELAKEDPAILNELRIYLNEQKAIVRDIIRKWYTLKEKNVFVVSEGSLENVSTNEELSCILSKIMTKAFGQTLIVNNDLLNKNVLSGPMKLARKRALLGVMEEDDIYVNCSFLSPEYNVLRSVLSKNGIVSNESTLSKNKVEDSELNRFDDGMVSGTPVMDAIKGLLLYAEQAPLPLSELYEMLKKEPFGLRDGYIPVIIAYALRNYQNVSLYFHGKEHSYTEDELIKGLSNSEDYTLFISNWNENEIAYIEALEDVFSDYLLKEVSLNRLEELFNAINLHYSSVSKSARTTELYVSEMTKEYRNILSFSYDDYTAFFFKVLPSLNNNLQELVVQIRDIKYELETVDEKQYVRVLRTIKNTLEIGENRDLMESVQKIYLNDWASKSHKVFDYITNEVLDLVSKSHSMLEKDFVYELAKVVTGFELSYWTDNKIIDFEKSLNDSVTKLKDSNPNQEVRLGDTKITIESPEMEPIISQFSQEDLSIVGQTMLQKMKNTIDNFGESIEYEEKISIIVKILKDMLN